MKKLLTIIITLTLFSCQNNDSIEKVVQQHTELSDDIILNDEDYEKIVKADKQIKLEIIKGVFTDYKSFLDKEMAEKGNYCLIKEGLNESVPKDLMNYISINCARRTHFENFTARYPGYLAMSVEKKLNLKRKAEKKYGIYQSPEETLKLIKQYRLKTND